MYTGNSLALEIECFAILAYEGLTLSNCLDIQFPNDLNMCTGVLRAYRILLTEVSEVLITCKVHIIHLIAILCCCGQTLL